jgi:EAL domain-containing protein (putative c-di-GMP-specific phosphodiesterase class I)/DNA-binding response OmpR family regulator
MAEPTWEDASIVVVDDEPANVRLLEATLGRAGFRRVAGFTDPQVALAAIAEGEPDLVLLDLHMPEPDGFACLETLRRDQVPGSYLPIVILTADTQPGPKRRALALGATDFLAKPLDIEEVILRCRNLLDTRRLHRELSGRSERLAAQVSDQQATLEAVRRERLAVASALSAILSAPSIEGDPDRVAQALCADLVDSGRMDGAALIEFGPDGRANARASAGHIGRRISGGRELPGALVTRLRERAEAGPWVEGGGGAGNDRDELVDPRAGSRLWVPIRHRTDVVGVLLAATRTSLVGDHLIGLLPVVLEYATVAGAVLGAAMAERRRTGDLRAALDTVIEQGAFCPVFQPIVDLETGFVIGHEALTRFDDRVAPDRRFADAAMLGFGIDLELACASRAISEARALPDGSWLSVNLSPTVVLETDRVARLLSSADRPIVLELTEHLPIDDYPTVRRALEALGLGLRIAIDDAGAGFASFRHIVELRPDFVKLDIGLVRDIDKDPVRQALISGLDYFALKSGCTLIGEGIETDGERDMLRSLAVPLGQGYLLGRPEPPGGPSPA